MKKILSIVLFIVIVFAMSVMIFESKNIDERGADVTFKYPVTPEMDEWKELRSLDEMIAVCQIPDDVLRKINTENLIDVILDYPPAINIFAYNTPKEGIERVAAYFNGLQELQSRKDSVKILNARVEALAQKEAAEPEKEAFANAIFELLS